MYNTALLIPAEYEQFEAAIEVGTASTTFAMKKGVLDVSTGMDTVEIYCCLH